MKTTKQSLTKLILCMAAALIVVSPVKNASAEPIVHVMNEGNNWDISNELIAVDDTFVTQGTTRNELYPVGTAGFLERGIDHLYYEYDMDGQKDKTEHLNRSKDNYSTENCPYQIKFEKKSGETNSYTGEDGRPTHETYYYLTAPTITYYEPYYHINYESVDHEGMVEEEIAELPDRYYVDNETHELKLPKLHRDGYTFEGYRLYHNNYEISLDTIMGSEPVETDDYITYSYTWLNMSKWYRDADLTFKVKWSDEPGYTFDESTGKLKIYNSRGVYNWYNIHKTEYDAARESGYKDQSFLGTIKTAEVKEGVTFLSNIFKGCASLESVTLPSTLTDIDDGFDYCSSLAALTFSAPNGLDELGHNEIGVHACTSLRDVTFTTTDVEAFKRVYDDTFDLCNPNLKIHVDPSIADAVKGARPIFASRVNTDDDTEYYGLIVNGEEVTDKHLTVECGEGTAVFDPETSTLTLDNATLTRSNNTGVFYYDNNDPISNIGVFTTLPDLKIVLNGVNTVKNLVDAGTASAIYSANGSVTITGGGTLTQENHRSDSIQICCKSESPDREGILTIDGATLSGGLTLTTYVYDGKGDKSVIIKDADLSDVRIDCYGPRLAVTDSTVQGNSSIWLNNTSVELNYSQFSGYVDFDSASKVTVNGGHTQFDVVNVEGLLEKIRLGMDTKITKHENGQIIIEGPAEPPKPLEVEPVVPVKTAENKIEIPVTVTDRERAAELNEIELFVAEYDENGALIGVKLGTKGAIEGDTLTVTADIPEGEHYKFMLWDRINVPLMNPIEDVGTVAEKQ